MSAKASSDVGQGDRQGQGMDQPMQQADGAAGSNASNVGAGSDGSDGSNGQGDKKEESSGPGGEEEEEGPTNPWLVVAAVVGVGAAVSYWFVEELKDDEDLRENMSDDYPEAMAALRKVITIDPPADGEPTIRFDTQRTIDAVLVSSTGRTYKASCAPTLPQNSLTTMFNLLRDGEPLPPPLTVKTPGTDTVTTYPNSVEALDGEGPPKPDEKVVDVVFFDDEGRVPKQYRDPTEEELIEMVASLKKQEQWAAQHKKQYWWFTEERKVFRDYTNVMRDQRKQAEDRLKLLRETAEKMLERKQ